MAKRGRKPSGKRKGYFYEEEEKAIVNYINEKDEWKKNLIYRTYLMPAFDKMISSIIRRYKLYVPDEEYEQTFMDTLSYLFTKIENFKPEKGTKAYSYCGTIAKNYLIAKNVQYVKHNQRNLPYDDMVEEINNGFNYTMDDMEYDNSTNILVRKISKGIEDMIETNPELTDSEKRVGRALVLLINNWEDILKDANGSNKMNKSSVLYFLREQTMMSTKDLRDNMKCYKKAYRALKNEIFK